MSWFGDRYNEIKAVIRGNRAGLNDPNFTAGIQFWTPGDPIWTPKNYATFIREGYKKNPTVYACINKISGAAGGIDWKIYTSRDEKTAKTIDNHPLLELWRNPNPNTKGAGILVEKLFGFWHIAGNSYLYAYRPNPNEPPLALWHLRPDQMKAVAGPSGVTGYIYGYGTDKAEIYSIDDIMHLKFPDYDDDIYGLSPIESAAYFSDLQNEAMGWNISLMQNAGRPASVFFAKGLLTEEQRNQVREELRKKYSGKRNAGRPLILEADMDWKNMSLTPAELDFLKSFELSTREIAKVFDIAPELIGDSAGKTFANVAEARAALYLENVLPKLDRVSDYVNSWLVPMYPDLAGSGAYFDYDHDDIEALQAVYAQIKKGIHDLARADYEGGGITLNEYREAIGKDEVEGGDCFRIGAILVSVDSLEDYADQSITEPAAPPMPVPEPLNVPALPGANPNQPQLPAPKTPTNVKPAAKTPTSKKAKTDDPTIWQASDVDERLDQYYADGVTHLRWICDPGACDICEPNNGVMVETGDAFPSGHYLTPGHPNCKCSIVTYSAPEFGKSVDVRELAHKFMEYLHESIKHHEENTTIPASEHTSNEGGTVHELATSSVTFSLPMRLLPVQTKASEEAATVEASSQTMELVTSGDIYRAFMRRYN